LELDNILKRRRTPAGYRICDGLTEPLVYFLIFFGPWAFGTTQVWAVWISNLIGYALGALLFIKWGIRWCTGCSPDRWDKSSAANQNAAEPSRPARPWGTRIRNHLNPAFWLGLLTILVLGYCLISAMNARATYHPARHFLEFRPALTWLPHSFDSRPTWEAFWQYLGLALAFWAIRDWLMGLSPVDTHLQALTQQTKAVSEGPVPVPLDQSNHRQTHERRSQEYSLFPTRMHRLLLALFLNGMLLASEGIVQRLSGTDKLLWIKRPQFETNAGQFGPYAYRSNAVQYLNLLWPVGAGYAWTLARQANRARRNGFFPFSHAYYWLPISALLMVSCSVISGSRAGAFVAVVQLIFLGLILFASARHMSWKRQLGLLATLILTVQVAAYLGWDQLLPRLKGSIWEQYQIRQQTALENSLQMARDFPVFGTGPGTFAWLYQFYFNAGDFWLAHVHNDWLETRITFGWVGLALVLLCLLPVGLNWFLGSGLPVPAVLAASLGLALAGCLIEAWLDFPLQVHSILSLFVLLCCLLFSSQKPIASERSRTRGRVIRTWHEMPGVIPIRPHTEVGTHPPPVSSANSAVAPIHRQPT
jgi:hypothetical protein